MEGNIVKEVFQNKEDLVIFDVGAADFKDSIALRGEFPNSTIYSFEPDESNVKRFGNLAEKIYSINVVKKALSDVEGELTFYPSEQLKGEDWKFSGSTIKPRVKDGTNEGYYHEGLTFDLHGYKVESTTLEKFCKYSNIDRIDYMRLDVQGGETNVVKGFGKYRPSIIFAETCEYETYETNTNIDEFDNLMKSLGYTIKKRFQYDTLYFHESII